MALRRQGEKIAVEVGRLAEALPLQPVLNRMPGAGIRTAARLVTEVSGKACATTEPVTASGG